MDTHNWDVVCACSARRLNDLLVEQFAKTPASLSVSDEAGNDLQADFDPWRIVDGGSVKKVHIELPVKKGSLTTPLGKYDLAGVVSVIEVELAFVDDAAKKQTDLKFDLRETSTEEGDDTAGSVLVVNADKDKVLAKADPSGAAAMTLHELLPRCLVANRAKLGYVFTTLNLTPAGEASWLAPKHVAYTYVQGEKGAAGYLAIFSLLSAAADPAKLQLVIDPRLCDGKSDVCVAFAQQIFLEHVIKPALPAAYNGTTAQDWVVQPNGIACSKAIPLDKVRAGLIDYYPILSSVRIGVKGSVFGAKAQGRFDITGLAGAYTDFSVSSSATMSFDKVKKIVVMTKSGKAISNHNTHIPCWEYAIAAVTLVEGIVVAAVITAVVDIVISTVTESIAGAVDESTTSRSGNLPLADWAATAIQWPGSERWTVDDAVLSDALTLHCTLVKKS